MATSQAELGSIIVTGMRSKVVGMRHRTHRLSLTRTQSPYVNGLSGRQQYRPFGPPPSRPFHIAFCASQSQAPHAVAHIAVNPDAYVTTWRLPPARRLPSAAAPHINATFIQHRLK